MDRIYGNAVVIDGGEVSLSSRIDGGETSLTRNIDGGEVGDSFVPLPHISIGEVETLAPDEEATATMTGTASRPVLNLGLVQGEKGNKGDKGDTGTLNSVTATVDSNTGTPSVEVTYDGANAEFNFHNLKGADGAGAVESVNGQTGTVVLDAEDVGALPDNTVIPSKTSDLTNDSGFITTETDPTVPSWAKASAKPSYTASEVGALPDDTAIPSKISDLTNDMVYDLGTPTFNANGTFNLTQEQHTAIMQMWNNGLCAVTITVFDKPYWAIKEGVFTLANDMTFNCFVGAWGTIRVDGTTASGTVAIGIMPTMPIGGFFYSTDLTEARLPTRVSDLRNDMHYLTLETLPIWDGSVT